jgi:hypothetical protein
LDDVRQAIGGAAQVRTYSDGVDTLKAPPDQAEQDSSGAGPQFSGMSLAEAAVEHLKGFNKPISTGKICAVLEDAGYEFASGHPTRALGEALRKRASHHNDVFLVGNGLWAYTHNFTPLRIKKLTKKLGGMGGRSADDHAERTKDGIARASAKGIKVGAKLKFTAEKVVEFRRIIDGGSTIGAACKAVGITATTYQNYKSRMELWKEGEPWPPSQKSAISDIESTRDARPALRVVKS